LLLIRREKELLLLVGAFLEYSHEEEGLERLGRENLVAGIPHSFLYPTSYKLGDLSKDCAV
jgi:hypothetical protein